MNTCFRGLIRPVLPALLLAVLSITASSHPARAAWSNDPAVNLALGDGAGEQVLPKIDGLPDGTCYVGWFDNGKGNYDVHLQHLDPDGNELWSHNGLEVSSHTQDTSLTDWDLICDSAGNCVLTFSDIRSGNLDVQAYKIGPDGSFLWGPDGINISQNAAWEPTPSVCQASDGDYVFAWGRYPDAGGAAMMMQRVASDGTLRFTAGGIPVVTVTGEMPAFPCLVPSLGGDVLLMWVRDIHSYTSPRNIRLQRFSSAGAAVWPAFVPLFDGGAVPMGYAPTIQSDGAGGAVCGWHYAAANMFNAYVQKVSAAGVEAFTHNGIPVSLDSSRHHIDPTTAYNQATGEIYVFWNERNSLQSQWGIYAQRFSSAGDRLWTNTGLVLQPVNSIYKSYPRSAPTSDGAICMVTDTPAGFSGDRLIAYRLDTAGANVWATVPLLMATTQSSKSRLPVFVDGSNQVRIIWEDDRAGDPDIYAQNLNLDGTLGSNSAGIGGQRGPLVWVRNSPNPFIHETELSLSGGRTTPSALLIAGPDGRVVRRMALGRPAGDRVECRWDGRDQSGRLLPAGVYTYTFAGAGPGNPAGKALLIR